MQVMPGRHFLDGGLLYSFTEYHGNTDPPSVKLHDKMAKQRMKMSLIINTQTSRTKGQNVVLKAGRNLFSQMILVAEIRSVNMGDVLSTGAIARGTVKCRLVLTKDK